MPSPGKRPRLPVRMLNALVRAVERARGGPPHLAEREPALVDAARRKTGLHDLGDPAALEGLRVLLRAYDEEARLTPFGRMMVLGQLGAVLRARLTTEAALAADPSLREAPVRRPIFVLGLPRTGTTALHHLLARDPANQVLEYWIAAAPRPRPPRETWAREPRFRDARRELGLTYWLDPGLKAIHWMTADGPEECRHLLQQRFTDDTFDSNATIPSYTRWYAEQDMRPSYERHRDVLRIVQATSPERRWVLKYPAHLAHLHVLLDVYPDACIVQTHRDPARVLPSLVSLVTNWRGIYEDTVDVAGVARWQVDLWAQRMEHAMAVRAARPDARFVDLAFPELMADPVAAVKRLYGDLGRELSAEAEAAMRAWVAENPPGRHGGHAYSAEAFGLSEAGIRERYARYMTHFDVAPEGADAAGRGPGGARSGAGSRKPAASS